MIINLEWWQWLLPLVIASAVMGVYMGWRVMAIWTMGVYFSGLIAHTMGPKLERLINKVLSVFAQFVALAMDRDESAISSPTIDITSPWEPFATGIFFVSLVFLSWWVARKLTNRGELGLLGHLLGGVFGGLAAIVGLAQGLNYWSDFVARSGSNPSGGAGLTVPQISIGVAPLPDNNPLATMICPLMGLFILLILVYTFWRVFRKAI
ncbi:MAG: hypothetical protein ABIO92_05720 [Chloroflexia bacterium]